MEQKDSAWLLGCKSVLWTLLQSVPLTLPRQNSSLWPLDISPAIPSPTSVSLHPTHASFYAFPTSPSISLNSPSSALADHRLCAMPKLPGALCSSGRSTMMLICAGASSKVRTASSRMIPNDSWRFARSGNTGSETYILPESSGARSSGSTL